MPNWIFNEVKVYIPKKVSKKKKAKEQFNDFLSSLGESKEFSLEAIRPTPKELCNMPAPPIVINDDEYQKISDKSEYISKSLSDKLIKKYNYNNWYDWNVCNWGCKWDVSEFALVNSSSCSYECQFLTAWGPPDAAIDYLREKYPLLCFENMSMELV